jgi:ssDNA-binding Zn-finger/Zn-ribbon topoisomerase 1
MASTRVKPNLPLDRKVKECGACAHKVIMDSTRLRLSLLGLNPEIDLDKAGLAEILAKAKQAHVEHVRTHPWRQRLSLATAIVCGLFLLLAMIFLIRSIHPAFALLAWTLMSVMFCLMFIASVRWRMRPFLHAALRRYGYELCPKCAYWMQGLNQRFTHCPECGADRLPLGRST